MIKDHVEDKSNGCYGDYYYSWSIVNISKLFLKKNPNKFLFIEGVRLVTYEVCNHDQHTPKLLDRLNCESKGENNERIRS
jgi:hypothetical protein